MTIVQPANGEQTEALLRWAVEESEANVAIRLAIGPSPRRIEPSRCVARNAGTRRGSPGR